PRRHDAIGKNSNSANTNNSPWNAMTNKMAKLDMTSTLATKNARKANTVRGCIGWSDENESGDRRAFMKSSGMPSGFASTGPSADLAELNRRHRVVMLAATLNAALAH